jgi:anthranilate synthase component 2
MSKTLLVDNYDSFTYNLYHYLEELWEEGVEVVRNDHLDSVNLNEFDKVVVSPGPGLPKEAGQLMKTLERIKETHQILGVCLGLQALAELFGYDLKNLGKVVHGQSTRMKVLEPTATLFQNLPQTFKVGRYHSWVMQPNNGGELKVTATDLEGNVMAIQHKELPIHAVQFHPESVLCEHGKEILRNWLK